MIAVSPPSPYAIWREFHWAFFLNVQGLIVSLRRFQLSVERGQLTSAEQELNTASTLLVSSAASMELAASFPKDVYEATVRTSMTQPHVESDDFSGLMSWDHAVLISVWRDLRPIFETLPNELVSAHSKFIAAYKYLAESHAGVCSRFVDSGSLRFEDRNAVDTLRRFERGRLGLIDPKGKGCPFHS
ncbi:siderophore biosynthesis protein [Agrobacterium vitis]|uniref:siderophore biosynthesis protein n=1 Tax=Agrobacterium vitis TaxID=373 RepID=UPI00157490AE|nr:siderophore biosynthesis protein [Agrobacterium vitis]NSZ20104.1 siderophore biosynthesis protein [Agrobacterium vitis]QZO07448.1 siderophore biosynthesis protein [Agrobacterium vitis]UJL90941.1 siderophore biosynthesis protein [Agrobacterium vitis]